MVGAGEHFKPLATLIIIVLSTEHGNCIMSKTGTFVRAFIVTV